MEKDKSRRAEAARPVRELPADLWRRGFAGRAAKAVHWVVGAVAFLVAASYASPGKVAMRTDAFAKAELVLVAADVLACLGIYLTKGAVDAMKARRRA